MTPGKVWDEIARHNDLTEFKKFADEIDIEVYVLIATLIMEHFLWIYDDGTLGITNDCPTGYFDIKNNSIGLSRNGKKAVRVLFSKQGYDWYSIEDNNDIENFRKIAKLLSTTPHYIIATLIYFGYFYLASNNVLTPIACKNNGYWAKNGNKIDITIDGLYLISDLIGKE